MKKTDPPIIIKKTYPVAIERVWSAITNVEQMTQWFFNNIPDFRPEIGFATQFVVENEGRTFTHLWEVKEVIPFQKLSYNWKYKEYAGDGYVVFELSKVPGGTELQLSNIVTKDYPSDILEFKRESGINGWEYLLGDALKKFLSQTF